MKKRKKTNAKDKAKNKIVAVDLRRKTTLLCWVLLLLSVGFGIYKNFTAVDQHTIHERKIIKAKVIDTNAVSTFVTDFANVYYTWAPERNILEQRQKQLDQYMMPSLVTLNADSVRSDIPTKSIIETVKIWQVKQQKAHNFKVLFSVQQSIEKGVDKDKKVNSVTATYTVTVMQNSNGDMVIVRNPTIAAAPAKAKIKEKSIQSDNTVDGTTTQQITKFLTTFFTLYPKGSANELKYYVQEGTKPLNKNYRFSELVNPIFQRNGDKIQVDVTVKYIDTDTDLTQLSQYTLTLNRVGGNWIIILGI